MKVLMLGTHFDDIELGVGGTLIRHVQKGDEVWLAVTNSDEWRTGDPKIRRKEQYDVFSPLLPSNGKEVNAILFESSKDDLPEIIRQLDEKGPWDGIYCPWPDDTHQDHVRTSQIGKAVSRKGGNLFYYDSGSALNFNPNVFVEIDFSKKLQLLKCFESQQLDYFKFELRDAHWGRTFLKSNHAEGLVVGRFIHNP